jgi:SAM-dependent methyltransferase
MHESNEFSKLNLAQLTELKRQRPADLALHNFIECNVPAASFARWMRVNCEIDPRDEIFRFFATHPTSLNPPRDYLADGWRSLSELLLLLDRIGRPLLKLQSMLEFASGYGRLTRHLAPLLGDRLWVSDVMPGSVDFAASRFGVRGFAAEVNPAAIKWPQQFDLVFVLSLLTHVPPAKWAPWLQALYAATAPGGALVFSVHSENCDKPEGVAFNADGWFFAPASESTHLDAGHYGTTYTTREWIARTCQAALGRPLSLHTETCFWIGQDAVVIEKPVERETSPARV